MRQTLDTGFNFLARHHHQVGHLIHDHYDIWQCLWIKFFRFKQWFAGAIIKTGLHGTAEHFTLRQSIFHPAVVTINISYAHF